MVNRFFITLLLYFSTPLLGQTDAVTYCLDAGRLGDKLLNYSKAKWVAYKYDLPLLYKPFPYSDKFFLHKYEKRYTTKFANRYKRHKRVDKDECIIANNSTLYITHHFTKVPYLYAAVKKYPDFGIELKKMISLTIPIESLKLPQDMITVALHVRKGSGEDTPLASQQFYDDYTYAPPMKYSPRRYSDHSHPSKFPPDQYYIDQLHKLSDLLSDIPLFVYVFTDYAHPSKLIEQYQQRLNKPNIIFDYRKTKNKHNISVLEDFFTMAYQFDCLIRPSSSLSIMAQVIGEHRIVIAPRQMVWHGNRLIAKKVHISFWNEATKNLMVEVFDKSTDNLKQKVSFVYN